LRLLTRSSHWGQPAILPSLKKRRNPPFA